MTFSYILRSENLIMSVGIATHNFSLLYTALSQVMVKTIGTFQYAWLEKSLEQNLAMPDIPLS